MQPTMRDRICMITGATSGMGRATAVALAQMGATVVMISRNQSKGEAVRDEIRMQSGNNNIEIILADLSSQQSIRNLADEFKKKYQQLHLRWLTPLILRFGKSPEEGAQTAIYLASSPQVEGITGRVYYESREQHSSRKSHNVMLQKQLWRVSEELTRTSVTV